MPDSKDSNGKSSDQANGWGNFEIPTLGWIAILAIALIGIGSFGYLAIPKHSHTAMQGYVGPKVCGKCHEKQAASWITTRMAQSFDVLRAGSKVKEKELVGLDPNEDYTRDVNCIPCHTTGYGKVGGFVSIEKTPDMAGVTCEACHGAGGVYVNNVMETADPTFNTSKARSAGLIYPPTARVCRACHNEDSPFIDMNYKFDYAQRVEKGTHKHFALKYEHDD